MSVAENTATGAVQPAALPIYKSGVMWGLFVSLAFKGLAVWNPGFVVPEGTEDETVQLILLGISAGGDVWAGISRVWSKLQPLFFTAGGAKEAAQSGNL